MKIDHDVIIIGAGPAGLMAAKILSKNNINYLLLSRESTPGENKPCGGFVPLRAFKEFELRPFQGTYPIQAIRMKFPGLNIVRVNFEETVGYNIARDILGLHLLHEIPNYQSHVKMNTEVTGLSIGSENCRIGIRNKEGVSTLTSNLIIDCSGINPVSVKTRTVRDRLPLNAVGYANQYYLERVASMPSFEPVNEFYYGSEFSPHGYSWIFPRGHEVVVGTGGLVEETRRSDKRLEDYLEYLIRETEPVKTELEGARLVKCDAALMPLAGIVRPSYSDRIMLAGDAGAHCSPITGEGIYYAMIAGRLAGTTAINAVQHQDFSKKQLRNYERDWTRVIGPDLRWGRWLQKRLMQGGSSELGKSFLTSKKNQRIIAEMLLGIRSVRSTIISIAPSYLKSKLL